MTWPRWALAVAVALAVALVIRDATGDRRLLAAARAEQPGGAAVSFEPLTFAAEWSRAHASPRIARRTRLALIAHDDSLLEIVGRSRRCTAPVDRLLLAEGLWQMAPTATAAREAEARAPRR